MTYYSQQFQNLGQSIRGLGESLRETRNRRELQKKQQEIDGILKSAMEPDIKMAQQFVQKSVNPAVWQGFDKNKYAEIAQQKGLMKPNMQKAMSGLMQSGYTKEAMAMRDKMIKERMVQQQQELLKRKATEVSPDKKAELEYKKTADLAEFTQQNLLKQQQNEFKKFISTDPVIMEKMDLLSDPKTGPQAFTDIAQAISSHPEYGGTDYAKQFLTTIKGGLVKPSAMADVRMMMHNFREEQEVFDKAIQYKLRNEKSISAATHMVDVNKILQGMGIPDGIYGDTNQFSIPGVGKGAKFYKKYMQGDAGVNLRTALAWLHNGIRSKLYGATLTEGEMDAFEQAAGTGWASDQNALFSGLRKINNELNQTLIPIGEKGVHDILRSEGVLTRENLPQVPKMNPSTYNLTEDDLEKMTLEELREFNKGN